MKRKRNRVETHHIVTTLLVRSILPSWPVVTDSVERARPKSASLIWWWLEMRMLEHLMSRCRIFFSCRKSSTSRSCRMMTLTALGENLYLASMRPPKSCSMYSNTRYRWEQRCSTRDEASCSRSLALSRSLLGSVALPPPARPSSLPPAAPSAAAPPPPPAPAPWLSVLTALSKCVAAFDTATSLSLTIFGCVKLLRNLSSRTAHSGKPK